MGEMHVREIDLAQLSQSDGNELQEVDTRRVEHLRWCAHCRSIMADHRWLQEEVTATLAVAANALPVPRSKWWAVREALSAHQRR